MGMGARAGKKILIVVCIGLLIAASTSLVSSIRSPDCHSLKTPTEKTVKSLDKQRRKCYEKSVERGLDYLDRNSGQVSPLQWLILDYLDRKFSLGPRFEFAKRHIQPPNEALDAEDFKIHKRIAQPDQLVDKLPYEEAPPIRKMMMAATHCDHIPLPRDYEQLLQQNLELGDYNMTHVSYSLERMQENGCSLPKEQDSELRDTVSARMAELIKKTDAKAELRYEAVAFLINMGRPELITTDMVDKIVTEQQADGGWKISNDSPASSDHATVLALWALLEYSQPNAPKVPVIRRP